ncbi:MAG: sulfurtransferase TusA family protein [Bacteroidaceae bacterium]|nr:sulfurtransferase TusA family protein [Bacteroidaceae bacterium]MBR2292204.1 sulfurtransferase TusA family protein [Prevotella sp.]
MYIIPESLTADINYNQQLIEKYEHGEISGAQLKSNRVPMGIYEQRQDGHFMLRIRCTGGLITPAQLRRVAEVGAKVNCSHIHITTRQEVQIHNVSINDATPALLLLKEVGLATQGGGGNTVRNMLVNEQGGISDRQTFDPYPYAVELTTRLIAEKDSWSMPRKLKIAFDMNEADANFSLVADLGLIPVIKDGQRGFKVYLGGSVASNPHKGWLVFDFLPEKDLLRAAKAAKNFFNLNGNRKNRHKARIRYIFYKNGEEETRRLYFEEYNKLADDATLDFKPAVLPFEYKVPTFEPIVDESDGFKVWKRRYASAQTVGQGFSAVIPFLHGNASPETFAKIADFLDAFGNDVIRFTPRQNMQLRNIPEAYLPNVYQFFKGLGLTLDEPVIINNLTSCTGADTCRLGICLPKGLVKGIRRKLEKSGLDLNQIPDLKININGCSNSCAQNAWTDLGFSGRIGRVEDHPYPAYNVWARVNGKTELAESLGYLAAKDIPAFVVDYLGQYLQVKDRYDSYDAFVRSEGAEIIKATIARYKDVPPFDEDKNYYFDWGADEVFSLTSHGQAECSAGLFDIIELDQSTIKEKQAELAKPDADTEALLHDIVFSASRMLLVTRGADPRTDDEVYDNFETLFIEPGIVPAEFRAIVEKARHGEPLSAARSQVDALAAKVNELYASMDDSLQFKTIATEAPKPASKPEAPKASGHADVQKDFRGVACPMNFVKTKIELSSMKSGALLEILLDDGQPIQNVPGSVRQEGHEVLSTEKVDNYWKVLIKKK